VLIGGDGFDDGEGIAVDANGDAYVLGRSSSFNFPRTRGVYGESFTSATVSTCAKLNATASDLIYGTHLHTANIVTPIGIAVDSRGIAFMTFELSRGTKFRPLAVNNDPNLCDGFEFIGAIPTTADALIGGAYTGGSSNGGDYGGATGGLIVLNPSGTNIVYGTRLGNNLDTQVYPPYVDKSGDVWVCGWVDTYRYYVRPHELTPGFPVIFNVRSLLPGTMISPLAFRPSPDPNNGLGGPGTTLLEELYNNEFDTWPITWYMWKDRDGWVDRIRVGLASVSGVSYAPATIPGGLGASSVGTVTLSQNAPAGGAVITLTMPANAPASFVSASTVTSTSITIPAGVRTGTFSVFSSQVSDNTPVDVTASYQGNFKVGRLVVVPWLQSFSITPTETVGGSGVTGTIQLSALAGSGGINVPLTSDTPSLVNVPATITIPPGQSAVAFTIGTNGVDADTTVTLTASLLGVGKPFQLIIHPSQLKAITFKPSPVTSGTSTVATVVVTGDPGANGFDVNLSVEGSPAGYTLTPNKLHFQRGTKSLTSIMTTPYESQTVNRTVDAVMVPTAGYTANTVKGTISVTASSITTFTLTPNPINGGATCVGQITLTAAALEGGANVDIAVSPDNGTVVAPKKVNIPQGQTTVSFNIPTTTTIAEQMFNITASRGTSTITKVLDVKPLTFTVSAPSVIAGGSSGTGSVVLSGPAPAGGIAVKLTSSNPALLPVPDTIAMTSGQSQITFPLNAGPVASDTDVIISAKIGTVTHSVTVTVHASTVTQLTIMPNYVLNLKTVRFTLTLDGPAPSGGLQVMLNSTNLSIATIPQFVTIPAGATSYSFSVATRRVSKTLVATITATATNGGQASATLTVHP
jgi:hypothetical protein